MHLFKSSSCPNVDDAPRRETMIGPQPKAFFLNPRSQFKRCQGHFYLKSPAWELHHAILKIFFCWTKEEFLRNRKIKLWRVDHLRLKQENWDKFKTKITVQYNLWSIVLKLWFLTRYFDFSCFSRNYSRYAIEKGINLISFLIPKIRMPASPKQWEAEILWLAARFCRVQFWASDRLASRSFSPDSRNSQKTKPV